MTESTQEKEKGGRKLENKATQFDCDQDKVQQLRDDLVLLEQLVTQVKNEKVTVLEKLDQVMQD